MKTLSESQRLTRMREVWQTGAPTDTELTSARRRLLPSARARSRGEPSSRFGAWSKVLPLDLALGMAAAATLIVVFSRFADPPQSAQPEVFITRAPNADPTQPARAGEVSPAGTEPSAEPGAVGQGEAIAVAAPRIERDGVVLEVFPGTEYEVRAGQTVVVQMGAERISVEGPRLIEFTFEADRASGFQLHLSELPDPLALKANGNPKGAPRAKESARTAPHGAVAHFNDGDRGTDVRGMEANQVGAWRRAAEAMREGDAARAERALEELSARGGAASRDAAALALAQLRVAEGRGASARAELERLSVHGATPLVRRRAQELLGR